MDDYQIRNGYASLKNFVSHYFVTYSHSFIILDCLTFLFPAGLDINVVTVLVLTSSFVFVIVKNGECQCSLPQTKTPGLHCKNVEAMTGGTEGGG